MDFFCSPRVPVGAAGSRPCRDGVPQWVGLWWLDAQVCRIWVAIPFSAADGPRPLAQGLSRCCMPPAASGRELLVGASAPGNLASQCAPSPRCKFRLGFSGLRAPHRFDHAAPPLLSPNVALWAAASSLHQFGVSDCRYRILGSKSLVISAKRGPVPHAAAILVFLELQDSIVFSSFLVVRGCRHCSEYCTGDRQCWDRV
ncbi:hypothetical protein NDU88_002641 [Pleurodeles waltl]|uniref:Uncharacterized protein n=1 Tax=Pleurodeles waltl TaxID=8319 RepID=A0AAV7PAM3_PLEWA|nr:hypothetical protein NDU88_002641 [Pleurodeles waltl]